MKHTTSLGKRALICALALSLMLGVGVCRPAATASAEEEGGLLAEHKDEIVDAILQAREDLRNTLDDIRAIRDEVKAREAAEEAEKPAQTPTEAEGTPVTGESTPTAPADSSETSSSTEGDSLRDTIRSTVRTRLAELEFEQSKGGEESGDPAAENPGVSDSYNDESQNKNTTRSSGDSLISIDISDITATLKDNPIEHNVPVNVFSNNKHFSDNTIVHQRVYESQRYYPAGPSDYTYSTAPKTGDANNIGLWVAVIGVSAAALAATLVILKKRKS